MIRFENVSRKFQEIYAIKDVSLTIDRGEKFVLLGTSGSGKSTVLKHINFLLAASEGKVFIEEEDIRSIDKIRLRRNTGYIIQDAGLFPHYTVEQNIGLIPQLNGISKDRTNQKVHDLMASLKLEASLVKKYPRELSGGQRQRVGIARALAGDPDMLLLDEALSALDPITKVHIQDDFMHLEELKSKTMVWVTHDIKEAFKVGDRICLMDQGTIQQIGRAQDFLLSPKNAFVRNFFSSDRITYLIQTLTLGDLIQYLEPESISASKTSIELPSPSHVKKLFDMTMLPEQIRIVSPDQEQFISSPEAIFKVLIQTSKIS